MSVRLEGHNDSNTMKDMPECLSRLTKPSLPLKCEPSKQKSDFKYTSRNLLKETNIKKEVVTLKLRAQVFNF